MVPQLAHPRATSSNCLLHQRLPPTSVRHTGAVATGWFAGRRVSAAWHAGSHRRRWGQTLPDGHSGKPWDASRRRRKGDRGFVHTAHEVAKGQCIQFLNHQHEKEWDICSSICGNRLQLLYVAMVTLSSHRPSSAFSRMQSQDFESTCSTKRQLKGAHTSHAKLCYKQIHETIII